MDDPDIIRHIDRLVDEEHRLRQLSEGLLSARGAVQRLAHIEVTLDQCWDLLRQRRGLRHARQEPATASLRPAVVVEAYAQ